MQLHRALVPSLNNEHCGGVFRWANQGARVAAAQHSTAVRRAAERWLREGCRIHAAIDPEPRESGCAGLGAQSLLP